MAALSFPFEDPGAGGLVGVRLGARELLPGMRLIRLRGGIVIVRAVGLDNAGGALIISEDSAGRTWRDALPAGAGLLRLAGFPGRAAAPARTTSQERGGAGPGPAASHHSPDRTNEET